jgi:acyl-CoA hydrolase
MLVPDAVVETPCVAEDGEIVVGVRVDDTSAVVVVAAAVVMTAVVACVVVVGVSVVTGAVV